MKKRNPNAKRDKARDAMRAAFKAFCDRRGVTYQVGWKKRRKAA